MYSIANILLKNHFLYNNFAECFLVSYQNLHKYVIQEMFLQMH
jgi:hypothetical protein